MSVFHQDINSKRIAAFIKKIESSTPFDLDDINLLTKIYSLIEDTSKKIIFFLKLNKLLTLPLKEEIKEKMLKQLWQISGGNVRIPINVFFTTYSDIPLDLTRGFLHDGYVYISNKLFNETILLLYFEHFKSLYVDIMLGSLESVLKILNLECFENLKEKNVRPPLFSPNKKLVKIKPSNLEIISELNFPKYIHVILDMLRNNSTDLKHYHWYFLVRYLYNAGYNEKEIHIFLKESPKYKKAIAEPQVNYIVIRQYGPPSMVELKNNGLITDEEASNEINLFPNLRPK